MLTNFINLLIAITILQNGEPQVRFLKNISVTQGQYCDRIVVEWDKIEGASYTVMRSQLKTGEFTIVAQTSDPKFEDLTIETGTKYWYKVIPSLTAGITPDETIFISDEEYNAYPEAVYVEPVINKPDKKSDTDPPAKTPVSYSGYTSIETYHGVKLDDLLKQKKANFKTASGVEEKNKQKIQLDYIKQYYMNPVKLTLFLTMSRPHIDNGELKILTDCDSFEISEDMRNVIFYNQKYHYRVDFSSKIIRKVISRINDPELIDTLLKNSEMFCIYNGKNFIVDKKGITRLVNTFDAVGLSTRYLKNDIEWRSRTIMLSTSRADLNEKLKGAGREE